MIELRTLGTLALRDPNGEDLHSVLAQPKRVALLAYLAIARPHGFHRRDTLLALLWPELDEQHARGALNQALRHLRTALGKEAVPSRGDGEIGIDVRALSCDSVAAGHWARRAFALAPDDEGEARNLIALLGRLGDRAGAVQAYEEFARRLRVEDEVEPAPETLATIRAVRTRQVTTTSPAAAVDHP